MSGVITCNKANCQELATHGSKIIPRPIYCASCAPRCYSHIRLLCKYGDCLKQSIIGSNNCEEHKNINTVSERQYKRACNSPDGDTCNWPDCKIRARYTYDLNVDKMFCQIHAPKEYKAYGSQCMYEGCSKRPGYSKDYGMRSGYCKEHAPEGFIFIRYRTCKVYGCSKVIKYGPRKSRSMYCIDHKEFGEYNSLDERCIVTMCPCTPIYTDIINSYKPIYCTEHIPINPIDVATRCTECNQIKAISCKCKPPPSYDSILQQLYESFLDNYDTV